MRKNITISLAGSQDDAELRQILEDTTLPGWVSFSYRCEPSLFKALDATSSVNQVVIARKDDTGKAIGFFSRQTRTVFIEGREKQIGYLGQLRFDPSFRHPFQIMRAGWAFWREHLISQTEVPFDLTSILSDNLPARRLLEAGVSGLPVYSPIADYSTLAIRSGGQTMSKVGNGVVVGNKEQLPEIVDFIRQNYAEKQFAPAIPDAEFYALITNRILQAEDFLVLREGGEIIATLAIWDQRHHKQTVVAGYSHLARMARPVLNIFAPMIGIPTLPSVGTGLNQAYLAFISAAPEYGDRSLRSLISAARNHATRRGIDILMTGSIKNSFLDNVVKKHFRHMEYSSIIYGVHWPDQEIDNKILQNRPAHFELALL
ncbi:MAG: hypothetical protein GY742_17230 [Hyphomicrobiales bacterium]|nr:hypothetical protein [Hyphomicrobiales bacterium]